MGDKVEGKRVSEDLVLRDGTIGAVDDLRQSIGHIMPLAYSLCECIDVLYMCIMRACSKHAAKAFHVHVSIGERYAHVCSKCTRVFTTCEHVLSSNFVSRQQQQACVSERQ